MPRMSSLFCLFVCLFFCYFVTLFYRRTLCVLRSFASATTDGIDADPTLFQISKTEINIIKDCLYCTFCAKLMFKDPLFPGHVAMAVNGMDTPQVTSDAGFSRCTQNAKPSALINFHFQSCVRQVSHGAYTKLFPSVSSVFLARYRCNLASTRSSTFLLCTTHLWVPTSAVSFAWWRPS